MTIASRTVLITGTSSGFGEAAVHRFAAEGWNVIATMRNPSAAPAFPKNVLVMRLDVQDRSSAETAIAEGIAQFSAIDALVNNAGFGLHGFFETTPREKMLEQFEVNVFGLMDVTRAVLPLMRAQRHGVIVNVTSGAGVFGLPMISLYAASKFAVEGFSEALMHEVAPFGIAVKLVEPGGVRETRFGQRAGAEASGALDVADYAPLGERAAQVFAAISDSRSHGSSDEVADVIFAAATDGSKQLRYVATEGIKPWVEARRRDGEEAYIDMMRAAVGLGAL
ncbi:SDR family oxidoreductase [Rhizobium sp. EC-SD404]|uniref:SDR family oxidoreductase n=1 Tax=Rhizobium sp. EC-SD404 TaxID=2038389 RepID=UPI001253C85C|nr:SDR family oxidoreductase [Rhizobium sp. EC-SD404]VVS99198.1 Short-chain dehydrogenase/reductase [Rhizobium sp. EC-SD404]